MLPGVYNVSMLLGCTTFINVIRGVQPLSILSGCTITIINVIRVVQPYQIDDILILNKYVRPTALDKWQGIYCIEENDWLDIFKLCYFCSRETKLQSLQFKIVHRIIP